MPNTRRAVSLVLSLFLCCRAAIAATVDFTFTGTGITSGAFSIDDAALGPAFWGQISQFAPIFNFSLTISNIPDTDGTPLLFDPTGSNVFFGLDSGGIARVIPGATSSLPSGNFCRLTANTDFFAPPHTPDYHSVLDFISFSRVRTDDITWAPAVAAVPEPGGAVLIGFGAALLGAVFMGQRLPRIERGECLS